MELGLGDSNCLIGGYEQHLISLAEREREISEENFHLQFRYRSELFVSLLLQLECRNALREAATLFKATFQPYNSIQPTHYGSSSS